MGLPCIGCFKYAAAHRIYHIHGSVWCELLFHWWIFQQSNLVQWIEERSKETCQKAQIIPCKLSAADLYIFFLIFRGIVFFILLIRNSRAKFERFNFEEYASKWLGNGILINEVNWKIVTKKELNFFLNIKYSIVEIES